MFFNEVQKYENYLRINILVFNILSIPENQLIYFVFIMDSKKKRTHLECVFIFVKCLVNDYFKSYRSKCITFDHDLIKS